MSFDSERPVKKRKIDSSSDSDSQDDTPLPPTQNQSRIKQKQQDGSPGKVTQIKAQRPVQDDVPQSIAMSMDEDERITFAALNIDPWLVASLKHMSISQPTRIQKAAIPQIIAGRDCIGGSRTGSGKTVAFAAPILQVWARDPKGVFAVVLTPTRELALQLYEQFQAIGAPQGLKSVLVIGGANMREQAIEIAKRPHIIIATPGRLAEHIDMSGEDTVSGLRKVKFVVLDEADRLLASGRGSMLPDVEACLGVLPKSDLRQTCLFTATVTPEVRALKNLPRSASKLPVYVCEVDTDDLAIPTTLRQTYQLVNVIHKEKYLHVLLSTPENVDRVTIIFCNRTETATLLEHLLRRLSHRVTSLHSSLTHTERTSNLAKFRAKAARILVATDIAARGLDIPEVSIVINYDLPRNPDDYVHRVGRTARAGRKGTAISLIGQRDVELVQTIEERVGQQMAEYTEDKVNVEDTVVREVLNVVGTKKRQAVLAIEQGRDVTGRRRRRKINAVDL